MPAPVLQFKRGNAGVAGTVPALRPGEPAISLNNFDFFIGIDTSVANNKFFGSHRYWGREDGTTSLRLKLVDKDGTNYVAIKAPDTLAGIVTYQLPGTQGGASSVLTNDGSGNLSWASGSANPVFSGIATFSDSTDNTLGDPDTGAVQIDGGLGVNKNVTVGAGLSVLGESYFIGTCTFAGGTINIGDSDTDDIIIAGEFASNLIPSIDETYNIGTGTKRWKNASFGGIGTFSEGLIANNVRLGISGNGVVDTNSGPLSLNSATGTTIINDHLDVIGDLDVTGNVYIGGTTVALRGQDVIIENRDILLGVTTAILPNDTTANHGGIAIASTEGSPLVSFTATGINTFPDTYKQLMWFKSGTLGFATDAFAFNYGLAIGTTSMANGVRLAVGSGITMSDTSISATNFYGTVNGSITGNAASADQVKTVSAADNPANYYVTFVDANNGSATNETVYTDDGIYYNPGTNTFTTQYGYFTGNVTVDGTITGTATTATRATTIDTTATSTDAAYYVTFVDTSGGQNGETLRVGTALTLNASTGNVKSAGDLQAGSGYFGSANGTRGLYIYDTSGDVSFQGKAIVNSIRSSTDSNNAISLVGRDVTLERNVTIVGITTIGTGVGVTQFSGSVSTGTSESSVPTSKAVIDYVTSSIGAIDQDDDLTVAGDSGGNLTIDLDTETLSILGAENQIVTSGNTNTITVALRNDVVVGTSLSVPTIKTATIQHSNGTEAATIDTAGNVGISSNLSVSGNLYVNGSTTQVNTTAITVEDRTIELGVVNGVVPGSTTTWDLGVLFNYNSSGAKKSAVIWEHGDSRFKFASVLNADTNGTDVDTPQLSVTTFAPVEIGSLWVTDCAGTSQVISCTGSERFLENITVDAGTF